MTVNHRPAGLFVQHIVNTNQDFRITKEAEGSVDVEVVLAIFTFSPGDGVDTITLAVGQTTVIVNTAKVTPAQAGCPAVAVTGR